MLIQFLIIAFSLFVVVNIVLSYKRKNISFKGLLLWLILWMATCVVVLLPKTTTFFAKILGVGRGTDVVVYFSIVLLFYLVFRLFLKLEKIESEITKIIREIAIKSKKE